MQNVLGNKQNGKSLLIGLAPLSNPPQKSIFPTAIQLGVPFFSNPRPKCHICKCPFNKRGFPIPSRAMSVALKNVEYINYLTYIIL